MNTILYTLARHLSEIDSSTANEILALAGRYDKMNASGPPEIQPAFKYIMYLKLMHNLEDSAFHHMKRKYLNTSTEIQQECQTELDKIIAKDALRLGASSAVIRQEFEQKLKSIPQHLVDSL